jgi:excisionase family DNA binding protein
MHPDTSPRLAYGINQACKAVGLSRAFIYQEIAKGRLLTFKVGSRTLIAAEDLTDWLNSYKISPPQIEIGGADDN